MALQGLGDFRLCARGIDYEDHYAAQARLVFEHVARTPADKPIAWHWPSGQRGGRMAVSGFGAALRLAMDGTEAGGVEECPKCISRRSRRMGVRGIPMEIAAVLAQVACCACGVDRMRLSGQKFVARAPPVRPIA
jgi:hypothetical protein